MDDGRETVLQERVTLDQALLRGMATYRNGCNFRLRKEADSSWWLECGCYLLVNLVTGDDALLMAWLGGKDKLAPRRLDGACSPGTITELLRREPCACCGGVKFAAALSGAGTRTASDE